MATVGILTSLGDAGEADPSMWASFAAMMGGSTVAIMAFCAFNLLCAPCFAAIGAIRRQMASAKWTWATIGYLCGFAWCVGLMIYQLGGLVIGEVSPSTRGPSSRFWWLRPCSSSCSGPCRNSTRRAPRAGSKPTRTQRSGKETAMREIIMTPGSIAMLALLATWTVWACRRMTRRGLCDCSDKCGTAAAGVARARRAVPAPPPRRWPPTSRKR